MSELAEDSLSNSTQHSVTVSDVIVTLVYLTLVFTATVVTCKKAKRPPPRAYLAPPAPIPFSEKEVEAPWLKEGETIQERDTVVTQEVKEEKKAVKSTKVVAKTDKSCMLDTMYDVPKVDWNEPERSVLKDAKEEKPSPKK